MYNFHKKEAPLLGLQGSGGGLGFLAGGGAGPVGNGEGDSTISTSSGTYTSNASTYFSDAWRIDGGGGTNSPFDYSCSGNHSQFAFHTGHNGNSSHWPFRFVVDLINPQVLDSIDWYKHGNACGNCDIWGSNLAQTSGDYRNTNKYTLLGRVHMGGGGSSADCNVSSGTFNDGTLDTRAGYRYYMIDVVDSNSSSLAYPNAGTLGGWAMYGLRLKKS